MATNKTAAPAVAATILSDVGGRPRGLRLAFANGAELMIMPAELSEEIRAHALIHGLKQKLVDAAAVSRNPDTGRAASIDDKYNYVREVFDRITSPTGTWNKVRGEGGVSAGAGGLLLRALGRLYPAKTTEELRAYLAPMTGEQQAALRINKKIAPVIAAIKAEDAERRAETGEGDESDELLAGLDG